MTPIPDDLAAQCRQCAADLTSRNLLVAEAARGRAPGLLVGAAAEMERLRGAIDKWVARNVWQTIAADSVWQTTATDISKYRTRTEAEAAYRKQAFPGLDVAPAAGGEAPGGERTGEPNGGKD